MISLDISLVWVIINLLVLYLLLKKFLFKPVCKMMDERSAKIQSDLDGAAQAKADAEKIKADYTKLEQIIEEINASIENKKATLNETIINVEKLEGQINVIKEQINSAKNNESYINQRIQSITGEINCCKSD